MRKKNKLFVVSLSIGAILFFALICRPIDNHHKKVKCKKNLEALLITFNLFAQDEAGNLQSSFQGLSHSVSNPSVFICPATGHKTCPLDRIDEWCDYGFVSGLNSWDSPACLVLFCSPENHRGKGAFVAYLSGKVEWVNIEDFNSITNNYGKEYNGFKMTPETKVKMKIHNPNPVRSKN